MHIQLKAISRSFQRKKALDDLTLRFSDNECYALVGRNGAGKTTLLKTIAGLLRPDKGGISIDDQPYPAYPPAIRRRIGVLFGEETLLDELNALEYLQFVSLCYGVGKTKDEISRLFAFFFGDTNALNQRIRTYSTGMKQKIALCAAVIHQPDILLLDEPFAGIDPFSAGRYIDFINTYKKHRIVIVSSHDLEYIARVADRVGVIDAGRLITEASTADFTGNGEKDLATALFSIIAPDQAERHLLQDLFEKKTP